MEDLSRQPDIPVDLIGAGASTVVLDTRVAGNAQQRFALQASGSFSTCDASGNVTVLWDNTNGRLVLGNDDTIRINSSVGQPFVFDVDFTTNSGTNNPTLVIGYNVTGALSAADSRISSSKPGFTIEMEADYNSGVSRQMEWNMNYRDSGAVYRRGFVYIINNVTYAQSWQWRATNFGWTDDTAANQWALLNSAGMAIGANVSTVPARLNVIDASGVQFQCGYSGVIYTNLSTDVNGYFSITPTGAVTRFISGIARFEGATSPASGAGLEVGYNPGTTTGFFLAFDRTGAAYKTLTLDGFSIKLNSGSGGLVGVAMTPSCGLDVNGVIRAGGTSAPSTGAGVEIYSTGILSFNRNGPAYTPMSVDGSILNLNVLTAADIKWGVPLVALGGGAAPTLGTIGGSGPGTAAQNSWMRVKDSTGATFWVPAWK